MMFCVCFQIITLEEKALERKEKRAEKLEKIFLAEETQEKTILAKKATAARIVSLLLPNHLFSSTWCKVFLICLTFSSLFFYHFTILL